MPCQDKNVVYAFYPQNLSKPKLGVLVFVKELTVARDFDCNNYCYYTINREVLGLE